jgi:hypothetical protein
LKRPLLERFAFHPLLFATSPGLLLYSLNTSEVGFEELLEALGLSLALTLFIMVVARLILKSTAKAEAIASLLVFVCFLFQGVRLSLQESWTGLSLGAVHGIVAAMYLLILVCVVYPIWRARTVFGLTRILNVTGSFILLTSLAPLATYWAASAPAPELPARSNLAPPRQMARAGNFSYSPDIYFIVLDQYPRSDTLSNFLHYDNAPFLDHLRQMGFYVVEWSASNYPRTAQSICSTLNMSYLDKELLGPMNEGGVNAALYTDRAVSHNKAFAFVRRRGYRTVYLPPEFGAGIPEDVDVLLKSGDRLSEFHKVLLQMTPFEDLLEALSTPYSSMELHRRHVLFTLDALKKLPHMGLTLHAPLFVYAHILCPHPPIVFGADGENLPASAHGPTMPRPWIHDETYKRNYKRQVAFISKKALETVDAILSTSQRSPVIVLCSDHGSEFEVDWDHPVGSNLPERIANFDALYLPGDAAKRLYPTMTNVNIFRVIFDAYFEADFPLLPDRSYFSATATPYKFFLVPMAGPVSPLFMPAPADRNSGGTAPALLSPDGSGGNPEK